MTLALLLQSLEIWQDRKQTLDERSNTFKYPDGTLCSDREAAFILGRHYEKENRLTFNSEDKIITKSVRAFIQRYRWKTSNITAFNRAFTIEELAMLFAILFLTSHLD